MKRLAWTSCSSLGSALVLLALGAACGEADGLRATCEPADPANPRAFPRCDVGSGAFGRWDLDGQGLPAFHYTADQGSDPRAAWELTTGEQRTDHLFQIGNDRLIAILSNDGFVQLFTRDRAPTFLNRVDLEAGRTGGGYSLIAEGDEVWATAWQLRPEGASTDRLFGMGHARFETAHDGITVVHTVIAPPGDVTFVLDEVTVHNRSDRPRSLRHYEVWDVNRHELWLQLVRSGDLSPSLPESLDLEREALNNRFLQTTVAEQGAVRVAHTYNGAPPVPLEAPSNQDYYPADVFLARLVPSSTATPLALYADRESFYGTGSVVAPQAVVEASAPPDLPGPRSAAGQPAMLVDRLDLDLDPDEEVVLRYAYGYAEPGGSLPDLAAWTSTSARPLPTLAGALRDDLPYFVCDAAPVLHREMAWHASQLYAAVVWDGYLEAHTVVQGSAYMYLHGLDGAGRDFALFSLPLTYLRPALARDLLRTVMHMTYAETGQISYAVQGRGMLEDAVLHTAPSDLDIFFLWALTEYVTATGDREILEEDNPYWPRDAGAAETTLEHAARAFRHLHDDVGIGPHGLVRVGTGDWSDGIVFESDDVEQAHEVGESVPNTQMAVWVLPRAAGLFDDIDPDLAAEMREYGAQLRAAAEEEWIERWYRRAWFGPDDPFGEGHLNLEAQVWALISRIPDPARQDALVQEIRAQLDDSSPVGAPRVPGDLVWHAITGLLTWGYTRVSPELAWGSLTRHTLAAYAETNPDQWYGTWSGPDGIGIHGGTWSSLATPMRDWPVMNANQHALPLLALLRVAGLEPDERGDGLRIAPSVPSASFVLDLPLLRIEVAPDRISGVYRAHAAGSTVLHVAPIFTPVAATLDGAPVEVVSGADEVDLPLSFEPGDEVAFEVVADAP